MTATDELRRMLDEHGVEWGNVRNDGYESDYLTKWQINGIQGHAFVTVTEWPGGLTLETFQRCPTPEQAVAATLGRGTCHATSNPPVPKHWTGCSNCGSVWDFFYNICGYMGPPNFCPKCGAKVVDA